MDTNVTLIVLVLILAAVAIAALLRYQRRGEAEVKGPFGTGVKVKGSNEAPPTRPGVNITDAKASQGGILAENEGEGGVNVQRVETQDDIIASNKPAPAPKNNAKKA